MESRPRPYIYGVGVWGIIPVRATSSLPPSRARQAGLPGALRRLGAGAGLVVPAAALDAPAVHLRLLHGDEDLAGGGAHGALRRLPLLRPAPLDGGAGGGEPGVDRRHRQLQPGQEAQLPGRDPGAGGGAGGPAARGDRGADLPRRAGLPGGAGVGGAAAAAAGGAAAARPHPRARAPARGGQRLLPRRRAGARHGVHGVVLPDADRLSRRRRAGALPELDRAQSADRPGRALPPVVPGRGAGAGARHRGAGARRGCATMRRFSALQTPQDRLRRRNLSLVRFLLGRGVADGIPERSFRVLKSILRFPWRRVTPALLLAAAALAGASPPALAAPPKKAKPAA